MATILLGTAISCSRSPDPPGSGAPASARPEGPTTAPAPARPSATGAGSARPTAAPHADHDPRYGGVLTMEGDNHVEIVVAPEGTVDLYVSDAVRRPIPLADVSGSITIEPLAARDRKQVLTLTASSERGAMTAPGPVPVEKADYTWNLAVQGKPMIMTLRVPPGGTAGIGAGSTAAPKALHGGTVERVGGAAIEVKVERTGQLHVWLMGPGGEPRSTKGAAATVTPGGANAKEVSLTHDPALDALVGRLPPVQAGHLQLTIMITPPGGSPERAVVKLHFEAGHRH